MNAGYGQQFDKIAAAREEVATIRELIDAALDSDAEEAILSAYRIVLLKKKARLAELEDLEDVLHSVRWDAA
jgi:hypothetical protein